MRGFRNNFARLRLGTEENDVVLVAGDTEMDVAVGKPLLTEVLVLYPLGQRLVKLLFVNVQESILEVRCSCTHASAPPAC